MLEYIHTTHASAAVAVLMNMHTRKRKPVFIYACIHICVFIHVYKHIFFAGVSSSSRVSAHCWRGASSQGTHTYALLQCVVAECFFSGCCCCNVLLQSVAVCVSRAMC